MAYKLKLLKQGFQNIAPYILSEIYTSECRIMQLRIFVKTKFSGEHDHRLSDESLRVCYSKLIISR